MRRRTTLLLVFLVTLAGCSGGNGPETVTTPPTVSPTPTPTQTLTTSPALSPTLTTSTTPTKTLRGPDQGTTWQVTITRVVDGDTMEAKFPNGEVDTLRLLGVDTPETIYRNVDPAEFEGIPDTTTGQDHLFNWGEKATVFATEELDGETVRIETDPQANRRGSFGRLLVYIYTDGENFNKRLLEEGYARVYESTFSLREEFAAAETQAQRNDVGLWKFEGSTPTPTETATPSGGEGTGQLIVVNAHYDAPGNDHENLNEEYIVFENTGDASIEMGGWTISDEADHDYVVPAGFTLTPGATVTLYTGSGTDTDSDLYWGSGSAIWNNGGDTIFVKDGGVVVLEYTY